MLARVFGKNSARGPTPIAKNQGDGSDPGAPEYSQLEAKLTSPAEMLLRQRVDKLLASGDLQSAIDEIREWKEQHPCGGELEHRLGLLLARQGNLVAAIHAIERSLHFAPRNAVVLNDLGTVLRRAGRRGEALEYFQLATHHAPGLSTARLNLVVELDHLGDISEARSQCATVLANEAQNADAWFWQGRLADRCDEIDAAAESYEKALALAPEAAFIWTNLGLVRLRQGNIADAISCQRIALQIAPESADIHTNLGLALQSSGDFAGALKSYQQALSRAPNDQTILLHVAIAQLTDGDFERGWDGYEYRWVRETACQRRPVATAWNGMPLQDGNPILVWGEQGLGDQIMFASCIEGLVREGAPLILECDPRLMPLFARSFAQATVIGGLSQADLDDICQRHCVTTQVPIGSLPRFFRRSGSAFPPHNGYLIPDPAKRLEYRKRLAQLPGRLNVGISWAGGAPATRQRLRSLPLSDWSPILTAPEINFISLQYTPCDDAIEAAESAYGVRISHWQDAIDTFDNTAALVSELDLIVSVCTTVVHLAGALGVPTLVLTPAIPEWRYLARGTKMPWYPSVHLIRQTNTRGWSAVIAEVRMQISAKKQPADKSQ